MCWVAFFLTLRSTFCPPAFFHPPPTGHPLQTLRLPSTHRFLAFSIPLSLFTQGDSVSCVLSFIAPTVCLSFSWPPLHFPPFPQSALSSGFESPHTIFFPGYPSLPFGTAHSFFSTFFFLFPSSLGVLPPRVFLREVQSLRSFYFPSIFCFVWFVPTHPLFFFHKCVGRFSLFPRIFGSTHKMTPFFSPFVLLPLGTLFLREGLVTVPAFIGSSFLFNLFFYQVLPQKSLFPREALLCPV